MIAAAIAMVLAVSPTHKPAPSFMVYGPTPIASCGDWTLYRRENGENARAIEYWLLGYVSGYNRFSPNSKGDIAPQTSGSDLLAWTDTYCQAHPLESTVTAAGALIRTLEERAKRLR